MNTQEFIDDVFRLPTNSTKLLVEIIKIVKYPKGYLLLSEGKIEQKAYVIRKGIVRAFCFHDGCEITFWFGKEGDMAISLNSYVFGKKGYENIELLEDCVLLEIDTKKLKKLYAEDQNIANWGRKLAEKELIKTEKRLLSRQMHTASERYYELTCNEPDFLKRVKLSYIASFLGITQVSLSRIRAGKQ